MKDTTELLLEIHGTLARMDERSKANAEKLDVLKQTCETHTVLFERHGERLGALEATKTKAIAILTGLSIGGSAIGAKIAHLFSATPPNPPTH